MSDMNISTNPLLSSDEFVNYAALTPEHVVPAIEEAIAKAKKALEKVFSKSAWYAENPASTTFDQAIFPIIEAELIVTRAWAPVSNLLSLDGTPALRQAADKARPLVVAFHNDVTFDPRLFQIVSAYAASAEAKTLTGERARYLSNLQRDLRLAGAGLPEEQKAKLRELNLRLADLARRFTDNATDSKYEMVLTEADQLRGLPEDVLAAARHRADTFREKAGADRVPPGAHLFNLDYPSYVPFMRYSERSDLRKQLAFESLQRATPRATRGLLGDPADAGKSLDNAEIIREICAAKAEKAALLGFQNFAELSLAPKMAKDPNRVISFLESLAAKARPVAKKEYDALVAFQQEIGFKNSENDPNQLFPWDRAFLEEKLRKKRFDFDSKETKPYFELRRTLRGMFSLGEKLFGNTFERISNVPVWNADVEAYAVKDEHGKVLGTLFLDLYPRDTKNQGAWVNPLCNSYIDSSGKAHRAQCILVCNLTPPGPDFPSLLSYDEVRTLFHEFGHAMHHLLSTVSLEPLSGLNVAYDFVELPSQLLENFCTEEVFLTTFARHFETDAEIPATLLKKIKAAQHFLEGLMFIRQLEFGIFDMSVYTHGKGSSFDVDQLFRDVVTRIGVLGYWEGTHFPAGFGHIFGGGYAAGYYSYKWSELLEADAFSRFKDNGVLSSAVGREYRDKILCKGDSEEPMKLFVDFMGREPKDDALLERLANTI